MTSHLPLSENEKKKFLTSFNSDKIVWFVIELALVPCYLLLLSDCPVKFNK